MEIRYQRDLQHNNLILEGPEAADLSSYPFRILEEQRIPGFFRCHPQQMNGKLLLYYEVTGGDTLEELCSRRPLDGRMLHILIRSLLHALEVLQNYLLPETGLCVDSRLIYVDEEREEAYFVYSPAGNEGWKEQLRLFGQWLLPRLDPDDPEAVRVGYGFYQLCEDDRLKEKELSLLLCDPDRKDREEKEEAETPKDKRPKFFFREEQEKNSPDRKKETGFSEELRETDPAKREALRSFFEPEEETPEKGDRMESTARFFVLAGGIALCAGMILGYAAAGGVIGIGLAAVGAIFLLRSRKIREGEEQKKDMMRFQKPQEGEGKTQENSAESSAEKLPDGEEYGMLLQKNDYTL